MAYVLGTDGQERLEEYFDGIGRTLGRKERRAAFALYATGLLGESERKSVEPLAAQLCGDPTRCRAVTEQLLNFITESPWSDRLVRLYSARHALSAMTERKCIDAWILDDTGFLKQGDASPGVQRQYTGSAGKTANCQIGVSLTLCTRTMELPVDMDLYLPKSWTDDPVRCRAAHIPEETGYRPKWQIALDLVERAVDAGYPPGIVLGDSAYGDVGEFRNRIRALRLDYALDVKVHTRVQVIGDDGSLSDVMSVAAAADVLGPQAFRKTTWREGVRRTLASRFAATRVRVIGADGAPTDAQWLVIERPDPEKPPTHYVLSSLPKATSRKEIVRRIKQRWRIERTYEDLKGELGLDHFEGRSYRGWQHHVTCTLACFAFVVAERARVFPPEAARSQANHAVARAA